MCKKKYSFLIFDLDGVIFDSKKNMEHAWKKTCKKFNLKIRFDLYFKNIGLPFEKILENLKIKPKVICIEYNFWFGKNIKCSVPYNKDFIWKEGSLYSGASLKALNSLANQKDYFLVALESNCVNAFFIRGDLKDKFEILDPEKDFKTPIKYSKQQIESANKVILNKKLTIFE